MFPGWLPVVHVPTRDRALAAMVEPDNPWVCGLTAPAHHFLPMIFALDRGVPQFPIVVEKRLVLARLCVRVAVPFIEAAGAHVVPVDVDLE